MGMRGKRGKDRKPTGWIRQVIDEVYTSDMIQADFLSLEPEKRVTLRSSLDPKEHKVDNNSTFQLVITGLQNKVIDKQVIEQTALDAHDDDS